MTKLKRFGYIVLFILAMLIVISKMYIVMPAIGMVVCFGLGYLLAKIK